MLSRLDTLYNNLNPSSGCITDDNINWINDRHSRLCNEKPRSVIDNYAIHRMCPDPTICT